MLRVSDAVHLLGGSWYAGDDFLEPLLVLFRNEAADPDTLIKTQHRLFHVNDQNCV